MKKAIPFGYCHCGCGKKTKPARSSRTATGAIMGQPQRYLFNHQARGNKIIHRHAQKAKPKPQFVEVDGEPCVRIPLTMGKWALVSLASYPKVKEHVWLYSQGCACRWKRNGSKERMHRVIAGFPEGKKVKHRNGDLLDNRDGNLIKRG
jgi:hypothetical protein